jgi:hypothetical protein
MSEINVRSKIRKEVKEKLLHNLSNYTKTNN